MTAETVRVVIVGTGGIGKCHLRQWNELPDVQVVGAFDTNTDAAQRAAKQFNVPRVYKSLDEIVALSEVDAVDVCTPNMFHKEGVLAALQAGKHCLCEKPLAVHPDDIREMIAARDKSGKILATIQHMRFEDRTRALKRTIDAGRLGDVYYSRAWWLRRRMAPNTPGFIRKEQAGYGPGMDLGVHVLDLAMHLLDHPQPHSVTGIAPCMLGRRPDVANQWGSWKPEDFQVEDFAAAFIRFKNGSALSLEVSWLLNMIEPERYSVWLHGTEGGACWPDLNIAHVQDDLLVDSRITSDLKSDGHKNEMAAFLDAIRNGGPSPVPTEQSLTVARILAALYESAESGHEVLLD